MGDRPSDRTEVPRQPQPDDASRQDATGGDGRRDIRARKPLAQAARWTLVATVARQIFQVVGAVILARLLGPEVYGVVSLATLYVVVAGLILDQGLAAALIQRPSLPARLPGAVATLNLLLAGVLAAGTWFLAPMLEVFFAAPSLTLVLRLLGLGLLIKALAVVPRAMLTRNLDFKKLGKADIAGAVVGTVIGVSSAVLGAGPYSFVILSVATDVTVLLILVLAGVFHRPNGALGELWPILPYSLRIFATNTIAAFSRNTDNVLVGRYLGVTQLSFYAMAYRVLVIPVQMIGQTAARFMFPLLAGEAHDRKQMSAHLYRCTQALSAATIPLMVWVACASSELVLLVLGPAWIPTAGVLSVLAIAGARETIFYVTPSVMKATGRAALNLRFELFSTVVQVTGIVVGLQFGLIGVALGYTIAGFVITPVLMVIQRRLTGLPLLRQLEAILAPVIASAVGAAAYWGAGRVDLPSLWALVAGTVVYWVLAVAVALVLFPGWSRQSWSTGRMLLSRPSKTIEAPA